MKNVWSVLLVASLAVLSGCSRTDTSEEARKLAEANQRETDELREAVGARLLAVENRISALEGQLSARRTPALGDLAGASDSIESHMLLLEESLGRIEDELANLRSAATARDYWANDVEERLAQLGSRGNRGPGFGNMGMAMFGEGFDPQRTSAALDELFAKYAGRVANPAGFQADIMALKNSLATTKSTQELYSEVVSMLQQQRDAAQNASTQAWLNSSIDRINQLAQTGDNRLEPMLRFYERADVMRQIRDLATTYGIPEQDLGALGLGRGGRGRR